MSIKLYNGYRMPRLSMEDLLLLLQNFREKSLVTISKFYQARVLTEAVLIHDDYHYRGKYSSHVLSEECVYPYQEGISLVQDKSSEILQSNQRDPHNDFQLSIVFIPHGSYMYSIVYSENFTKLWENQEGVEYYPYWNNTDPPENLSWDEWKEREREWGEVLKEWQAPGKVGLSYEVSDTRYFNIGEGYLNFSKEGLPENLIPSFEKRLHRMSQDLAWCSHMEQSDLPKNDSSKMVREFQKWMGDKESKDLREVFENKLRGVMKETIEWDDLLKIEKPPLIPHDLNVLDL